MYIHPDCWDTFGISAENSLFSEDTGKGKSSAVKKVILYRHWIGGFVQDGITAVSEDMSFIRNFRSEDEARLYLAAAGMEISDTAQL